MDACTHDQDGLSDITIAPDHTESELDRAKGEKTEQLYIGIDSPLNYTVPYHEKRGSVPIQLYPSHARDEIPFTIQNMPLFPQPRLDCSFSFNLHVYIFDFLKLCTLHFYTDASRSRFTACFIILSHALLTLLLHYIVLLVNNLGSLLLFLFSQRNKYTTST